MTTTEPTITALLIEDDDRLARLLAEYLGGHGVVVSREADGLRYAMDSIDFWSGYVLDAVFDEPGGWELQNMLMLGKLMAWASLKRTESRGVHYRHDFPRTDDRRWRAHLTLVRDGIKSHQYRMESRTWPTLSARK